jgi:hypothetical protein
MYIALGIIHKDIFGTSLLSLAKKFLARLVKYTLGGLIRESLFVSSIFSWHSYTHIFFYWDVI